MKTLFRIISFFIKKKNKPFTLTKSRPDETIYINLSKATAISSLGEKYNFTVIGGNKNDFPEGCWMGGESKFIGGKSNEDSAS